MSDWHVVEVYATFMKLSGEIEVSPPDRLSDAINRFGTYLPMRNSSTEPISVDYPVLSRNYAQTTVRKAAVVLICPLEDDDGRNNPSLWRQKNRVGVAMNTQAFSLVGDMHLDPRHTLETHLEHFPGDFVPITNVSAIWVAASSSETHSVQRPFALLNPKTVLSFSSRYFARP